MLQITNYCCCVCAVLSQPMSIVLSGSGHVSSAASAGGTKLSQVVVTMDANRRTTLSLHQPNISQQHQSLQSVMADSSATVGQSVMSPPRPTILRKRPHDASVAFYFRYFVQIDYSIKGLQNFLKY